MNRLGSNKQAEEVGKHLVACGLFMGFAVDKISPALLFDEQMTHPVP